MKNVIITGVSGFIGKAFIKKLLQDNTKITLLTHSSEEKLAMLYPMVHVIQASMKDYSSLYHLLKGYDYDCMYHFAWDGSAGVKRRDYKLQMSNLDGTVSLYKLACSLSCKRFVTLGSIAERLVENDQSLTDTNPQLWYAVIKHQTYLRLHELSKHQKTELMWAQIPNCYGPHNDSGNLISYTLDSLKNGRILEFTKALQPYDLIHIDDLTEALMIMGTHPNFKYDHYYVGSGEPKRLRDFLTYIMSCFGYPSDDAFGKKEEDHLVFDIKWFDHLPFAKETGFVVSKRFEDHMKSLIEDMKGNDDVKSI